MHHAEEQDSGSFQDGGPGKKGKIRRKSADPREPTELADDDSHSDIAAQAEHETNLPNLLTTRCG